jgi:Rod binding domain-containing protein
MNTVSATEHGPVPNSQKLDPQRLARAAHEFESVLLNQLLGSLEHSFSTLSQKKSEAEDHYHFLGVQALTSHIASNGGIGIAEMIVHSLTPRSNRVTSLNATKSPSGLEGLNLNF